LGVTALWEKWVSDENSLQTKRKEPEKERESGKEWGKSEKRKNLKQDDTQNHCTKRKGIEK